MNRKVACLVLVIACVCAGSVARVAGSAGVRSEQKTVYYRSDLRILVDGRPTTLDVKPFIVDPGWIMVPVEFISKELGATVSWDDATSTLSITTGRQSQSALVPAPQSERQPRLTVNATNGRVSVTLSAPPRQTPLATDFAFLRSIYTVGWLSAGRVVLQVHDYKWDDATRTASFTFNPFPPGFADQTIAISASYRGLPFVQAESLTIPALILLRTVGQGCMLRVEPGILEADYLSRDYQYQWDEHGNMWAVVRVIGSGFQPNSHVSLSAPPGSGKLWGEANIGFDIAFSPMTDANGELQSGLSVPYPLTPGKYYLDARQNGFTARAEVEVRPAQPIQVAIQPVRPFPGQFITLRLSGLWPDSSAEDVPYSLQSGQVAVTQVSGVSGESAQASGSQQAIGSVSYGAIGEMCIAKVSQAGTAEMEFQIDPSFVRDGNTAFEVHQPGRTPFTVRCDLNTSAPSLRIDRSEVPAGADVALIGAGFAPGVLVGVSLVAADEHTSYVVEEILFDDGSVMAVGIKEIIPREDGSFECTIQAIATPGQCYVLAEQYGAKQYGRASVRAPILIK